MLDGYLAAAIGNLGTVYRIEIAQFPRGNSIIPTTAEILRSLIDRPLVDWRRVKTNTGRKHECEMRGIEFFLSHIFPPSSLPRSSRMKRVFSLDDPAPEDRPVVPHVRVSGSGCFPDIRGMMRKISPPRCNIGTATFHCMTHRVDHLESNLSILIYIYYTSSRYFYLFSPPRCESLFSRSFEFLIFH